MFKLNPAPEFDAKVPLSVPGADPVEVVFRFRHKTLAAANVWLDSAKGRTDHDLLTEIIVGWSGIVDAADAAVAYSPAALDSLLQNYPSAGRDIARAYNVELFRGRQKN